MGILMEKKEIALAEYNHLENIITNYSDKFYRIRNWLLVILSGLMVGFYTEKISVDKCDLWYGSLLFIILFYFMEIIQRVVQKKAMIRVAHVEKCLKGEEEYDGPKITESLKISENPLTLFLGVLIESKNALIWFPYLLMMFTVTALIYVKS